MVALHILLTGAMAIPYEATKYSIEWYALYKPVNKHLCNKGMFVCEWIYTKRKPVAYTKGNPDPSQGYGVFKSVPWLLPLVPVPVYLWVVLGS